MATLSSPRFGGRKGRAPVPQGAARWHTDETEADSPEDTAPLLATTVPIEALEEIQAAITCADVVLMVLFVLSTVLYIVLDKLVSLSVPHFPFAKGFLNTLLSLVMYPLVLLIARLRGTFKYPDNAGGVRWAFLVGLLFALFNVMSDLGNRGNVIPGPLAVLIGKLTVPAALMVDRFPCWRRGHSKFHYLGAVMLIGGVGASVLLEWNSMHFSENSADTVLYLGLLVLAVVPAALGVAVAGVYLERNPHTDGTYFWSWVVAAEVCFLPLLSIFNAFVQPLPLDEVWPNLVDGLICLVTARGHRSSSNAETDCASGTLYIWLALPCCITYNVCTPALARKPHLGGPAVYMMRALALPLCVLLFTLPLLMGTNVTPYSWRLFVGMLVVLLALLVYYGEEFRQWWILRHAAIQRAIPKLVRALTPSRYRTPLRNDVPQPQGQRANGVVPHSFSSRGGPAQVASAPDLRALDDESNPPHSVSSVNSDSDRPWVRR